MNLLSGSRTPVDTNTWRTAIGFFWVLVWVHGFFFIWIPQVHSILFLTANNNFIIVIYGIFLRRKLRSDGNFISPCELN